MNRNLKLSIICFALAFLCLTGLAYSAFATSYYVATASSGGDGTTTATSGAQAAFATVAAAQGKAGGYAAGDSILFKRGDIWREKFTVPSSGSAGSPITLGTYGTGALPIISGFDVASTYTLELQTPSVVNVSSNFGASTNTTSSAPAGALPGDLLVAYVQAKATGACPTITDPANWTLIGSDYTSATVRFHLIYHYYVAGETSYQWTSAGGTGGNMFSGIVCLRNAKSTSPIDTVSAWNYSASATSATALSLNTAVNNCMLLGPLAAGYGSRSWATITDWTELWDGAGGVGSIAMDTFLQASSGASGDQTSALTGGASTIAACQVSVLPTVTGAYGGGLGMGLGLH